MDRVALYGTSLCPVDGDSLASLVSRKSGEVVLFCPICGVAFCEPPPRWELNEIVRLDDLAPVRAELIRQKYSR
jgi:hypothetical protein